MNPVKIPTKLDEPMRFLFWRMDAFVVLISIVAIGGMTGHPVKAVFGGLLISFLFESFVKGKQVGLVSNYIYQKGFGKTTRTMVDPYKTKYRK